MCAATLLGSAAPGLSARSVIGGTQTQIQSAPWTVSIRQTTPAGSLLCTGSILDALHVLTAAHCVYDTTGVLAATSTFTIRAGISNFNSPLSSDAEQDRTVTSFRVHPGYTYSTTASPDDVAVLALNQPFDFSGQAVQPAPLPSTSMPFPNGATADLSGFGRESAGSADGSLNSLTVTIDQQGDCGGYSNAVEPYDNAIALCAAGSNSSICSGDSGSGLVSADSSHTLIAVATAAPPGCDLGSHGVYVYLAAPEILSFVQGNNTPVTAPRLDTTTYLDLYGEPPLRVGSKLTCESGNWENNPTLTYAFIDSAHNHVVQQGASGTLTLDAQTVGATIACEAIATNAGGTAVLETTSTTAIGAAPKLGIKNLPTIRIARGRAAAFTVFLNPADGVSGRFGVCLHPPARDAAQACATRSISNPEGELISFILRLKVKPTASIGTAKVSISAVAGASHGTSSVLLRVTR